MWLDHVIQPEVGGAVYDVEGAPVIRVIEDEQSGRRYDRFTPQQEREREVDLGRERILYGERRYSGEEEEEEEEVEVYFELHSFLMKYILLVAVGCCHDNHCPRLT